MAGYVGNVAVASSQPFFNVDPNLPESPPARQYQTIAAALTAGGTVLRLADGTDHNWDGTGLDPDDGAAIYADTRATLVVDGEVDVVADGAVRFSRVKFDIDTLAIQGTGILTVVVAPVTAGDLILIGGVPLTGIVGARTSGLQDFDASLTDVVSLAQEIADAINDVANGQLVTAVPDGLGGIVITAIVRGEDGNYSTDVICSNPGDITVDAPTLTGGAKARFTAGLKSATFEECSGELNVRMQEAPSGVGKAWEIVRCDIGLAILAGTPSEGGGGLELDTNNELDVRASAIRGIQTISAVKPVVDLSESNGDVDWDASFYDSSFDVLGDGPAVFANDAGGRLDVAVERCVVSLTGVWMAVDSSRADWRATTLCPAGGFSFGDNTGIGDQTGLRIVGVENGEVLPSDAPEGTVAELVEPAGTVPGWFVWRNGWWWANGSEIRLSLSSSPYTGVLPAAFDASVNVVDLSDYSDSQRVVRIQGEIIGSHFAGGTTAIAVFEVDAVLHLTTTPTESFVAGGGAQVPTYESSAGIMTATLVVDSAPQGFHVEVSTTTDMRVRANLRVTPVAE
jgi:hypothetical protein